ncbi:hypothetical protein MesoLj131a_64040 [Mesorhizobium sp. 131-2-1]|nr:hypothetical protein MesoLj131a_64040 [Mesorhizobium sp. 131-2-1]BCH04607.1 hypothetical protein MesoLj131b_66060 [Mesorhizobium sp. 131-2-5]
MRLVLPVERPARFDTCDFCQSVGTIRRFKRTGEKVFLPYRLRTVAWIDTRGAKKNHPFDAGSVSGIKNTDLNREVVMKEIDRGAGVRQYTTNLRGAHNDVIWPLRHEEPARLAPVK